MIDIASVPNVAKITTAVSSSKMSHRLHAVKMGGLDHRASPIEKHDVSEVQAMFCKLANPLRFVPYNLHVLFVHENHLTIDN
jgi:hypothetical protein